MLSQFGDRATYSIGPNPSLAFRLEDTAVAPSPSLGADVATYTVAISPSVPRFPSGLATVNPIANDPQETGRDREMAVILGAR